MATATQSITKKTTGKTARNGAQTASYGYLALASSNQVEGGNQMSQSTWLRRKDVAPIIEKINQSRNRSTWADDEDADVSSETVMHAEFIVKSVAQEFYYKGLIWQPPVVGSSPNGSIHLSWRFGEHKVSINVIGDGNHATCIEKYPEIGPKMTLMADKDSARAVVRCFERSIQ